MGTETIDGAIGYLSLNSQDGYASAVISLRAERDEARVELASRIESMEKAARAQVGMTARALNLEIGRREQTEAENQTFARALEKADSLASACFRMLDRFPDTLPEIMDELDVFSDARAAIGGEEESDG